MAHIIAGLFKNEKEAGEAVSELKQAGFTNNISVIAKDQDNGQLKTHLVKQKSANATIGGAVTGGVVGGLAGVALTLSSVVLPGIGTVIVAGPLASLWGLTGAATGALAGGLVGSLVDAGIPKERAELYEDAVKRGEVLVTVSIEHKDEGKVTSILNKHGVAKSGFDHHAFA